MGGQDSVATTVTCPVCACPVEGETVTCPRCDTPHHQDCWDYAGGCAIYGCSAGALRPRPSSPADLDVPLRDWSQLYGLHWAAFALVGIGFGGFVLFSVLSFVLALVAGGLAPPILAEVAAALVLVGKAAFAVVGLAATATYLALYPSARRATGRLEDLVRQPLELPTLSARPMLDRMDVPWFGRAIQATFRALSWGSLALAVVSLVIGVMQIYGFTHPALSGSMLSTAGLLVLFRLLFFSAFNLATEARLGYLVTTQNRLTASLKDH